MYPGVLNILVVDDELSITIAIRITLTSAGHTVDVLNSGKEALHHLLAGSVATGVLKAAVCPVLIVPVKKQA